jgi:glutaredoxin
MPQRILLFSQPGCIICEIVKMFLEAKEIVFEEHDMATEPSARAELLEIYHSHTAPTVVILTSSGSEVIEGFDPDRLDRCLAAA